MEPTPSEPTAGRRRRRSKEHPPSLSLFIKTLTAHKTWYIEAFNSRKGRMRQIVRELKKIAAEVKDVQRVTDAGRTAGAVTAGVGVGLLLAPFTRGFSLLAGGAAGAAGAVVGAAAGAAAAGGSFVVASNVVKTLIEKESAKEVEKLGEEFLKLVEPLNEKLQTIQTLFKEVEETSAAAQTKTEKFKRILYRKSGLGARTDITLSVVTARLGVMRGLLRLIVMIFRVTATPEKDKELTDSIIQSAHQSQKVVEAFQQMSQELRDTVQDISQTAHEVDDLPEYMTRAEFLQYSCDITLDQNTAHTRLLLSDQNRKVTHVSKHQSYSSHPDRFTNWPQVLSKESLTGRCYWEVERTGTVYVAVTYKNISRAGDSHECLFGSNDKSWRLDCSNSSYDFWYNKVWTPVSGPQSSRVGVYLDHRAGILSFYSVSETMTLLHRVQTTFTQPLHAGLGLYNDGDSAELCKL